MSENVPLGASPSSQYSPTEAASLFERQLDAMAPGTHLCALCTTHAEQMTVLAAFFRAGLRRGERCVYLADACSVEQEVDDLEASSGLEAREAIGRDQFRVVTARESYLRAQRFDPDAMIAFLLELEEQAFADGWTGLCLAGEMTWALGADVDGSRLFEYEARLNALPQSSRARILCVYDRTRFPSASVRAVLRTHPLAVLDDHVYENPYFEPGVHVLDPPDLQERQVDWMLDQITRRTQRAAALSDLASWALEPTPLSELINAAAQLVRLHTDSRLVEIFIFSSGGEAVSLEATAGGTEPSPDGHLAVADVWPRVGVPRGREPLLINDWSESAPLAKRPTLAAQAINSSAGFPIRAAGHLPAYGVIWVHGHERRVLTDVDITFVGVIANTLAEAIVRAGVEREFEALLANSEDVVARFDHDLRFSYVNPAMERIAGTHASRLLGKTPLDVGLMRETAASTWELALRSTWRTGREQTLELTVGTGTARRCLQTRVIPRLGPDGTVQSVLSVSRDVTAQRSAEEERLKLYPELVAQQARLMELIARVERNREREAQLALGAIEAAQLTRRQREVLALLAQGWTNRQIAAELKLAPGTVKNQVGRILAVLGVTDRTQAAVHAVMAGIAAKA
jgi:PAS domain S-box-containing protein